MSEQKLGTHNDLRSAVRARAGWRDYVKIALFVSWLTMMYWLWRFGHDFAAGLSDAH
jgi:hypothetical protein